jgi:hypothetical protein
MMSGNTKKPPNNPIMIKKEGYKQQDKNFKIFKDSSPDAVSVCKMSIRMCRGRSIMQ